MNMPWKNDPGLVSLLIAAGMTLFGTVASYAYRLLGGDPFSWRTLCLQIIVSMFAGFLMILMASYWGWPLEVMGCFCGLSGWAGPKFVMVLEKRFLNKVSGDGASNE